MWFDVQLLIPQIILNEPSVIEYLIPHTQFVYHL